MFGEETYETRASAAEWLDITGLQLDGAVWDEERQDVAALQPGQTAGAVPVVWYAPLGQVVLGECRSCKKTCRMRPVPSVAMPSGVVECPIHSDSSREVCCQYERQLMVLAADSVRMRVVGCVCVLVVCAELVLQVRHGRSDSGPAKPGRLFDVT